ncbi:hypothetical protein [Bradyrhizobium embrapense]
MAWGIEILLSLAASRFAVNFRGRNAAVLAIFVTEIARNDPKIVLAAPHEIFLAPHPDFQNPPPHSLGCFLGSATGSWGAFQRIS